MHIAIEGLDGVGKTTIAKELAKRLNFKFIDKPFKFITDKEDSIENYLEITKKVNRQMSPVIKRLFYGIGNILLKEKFQDDNIITDRHLVSNYFCNTNGKQDDIFEILLKYSSIPKITFLIYADENVRKQRMIERNPLDEDIKKVNTLDNPYEKMKNYLEINNMEYVLIDNTYLECNESVEKIISILKEKKII